MMPFPTSPACKVDTEFARRVWVDALLRPRYFFGNCRKCFFGIFSLADGGFATCAFEAPQALVMLG